MNSRFYKLLLVVISIIIIAVFAYFSFSTKPEVTNTQTNNTSTTTTEVKSDLVEYKNTEYGFSFTLPKSWKDFSIIEDVWQGDSIDAKGQVKQDTVEGPLISIRHPDWEYKSPRQDIPIMVFTLAQWADMQADKFHIGAAPINPSELGRNKKYVFAIPARYNFEYLTGFEEVEKILQGKPLKTF